MIRPLRRSVLCASVLVASSLVAASGPGERQPPSIARLDGSRIDASELTTKIEALTRAGRVHGLTVAVFNDGQAVYTHAFGVANISDKRPLRIDTEIYGASLSKAVFSVLVMRLVEQGVLDLDKPLQDYVREPLWKNRATAWHENLEDLQSDDRYRRITARMCMSHSTGLPNWRWFEPDQKLRIHFDPGSQFSYSGEGMTLLQVVIEKITGRKLEALMREHVFGPYGMTMSSYTWQPRFESEYAVGHAADGKPYPKDKDNAPRAPSTLETTTRDYARFVSAILGRRGLKEASWKQLFTPQIRIHNRTQFGPGWAEKTNANDGIELSYGIGWGLRRTPHGWAAFKEGHGDGFQHYSVIYPAKKLGVLLMSNSDNGESIFGHLLALTIADTFIPLEWHNYVPYDRARQRAPGDGAGPRPVLAEAPGPRALRPATEPTLRLEQPRPGCLHPKAGRGTYSGFAPKASRRPSQSFTTNSRESQGVLPRPRVNSTPRLAYSAYNASASSMNR